MLIISKEYDETKKVGKIIDVCGYIFHYALCLYLMLCVMHCLTNCVMRYTFRFVLHFAYSFMFYDDDYAHLCSLNSTYKALF